MERTTENNEYFSRVHLRFLIFLFLHLPLMLVTAWLSGTSAWQAVGFSLLLLSLPTYFVLTQRESLLTSISLAVSLVSFSALFIHLANGMVEMHFHVFVSLGLIIVLSQPISSLIALAVVAVHHISFYFLIPSSLINYKAGLDILFIHAAFAIAMGIPAAFIANTFKAYVVGVNTIVRKAELIGDKIRESTEGIGQTSRDLAISSDNESKSVLMAANALEELVASARSNVEMSSSIKSHSHSSQQKTEQGVATIAQMTQAMGELKNVNSQMEAAIQGSQVKLGEILALIELVGQKTQLIHEIVFQTKLLSFNASVEAARAGEAGKGFSVVAEEVGKLAVMSGNSAKEIEEMVQNSLKMVRAIIEGSRKEFDGLMNLSSSRMSSCIKNNEACEAVFQAIASDTKQIVVLLDQVAVATKEQSEGLSHISDATNNITAASQENATLAQSASKVAEELDHVTNDLSLTIHNLKIALGSEEINPRRAA